MTLILSGTDGLSDIDGSAATPAIRGTDANTGMFFPAADTIAFSEGGVEAMRLDSNGNVGIGTAVNVVADGVAQPRPLVVQSSSSTTTQYNSTNALVICNSDTTTNNASQINFAAITGASTTQYTAGIISCIYGARTNGQYPTGVLTFATSTSSNVSPTEKMRLDNSGNLLVATTNSNSSAFKFKVQSTTDICLGVASSTVVSGALTLNAINDANSINVPLDFRASAIHASNGIATTASPANANFSAGENNRFYRSTSALKYKQDIRDLESIDIGKFRPVRYKSKCENDDQTKDYFGIVADEVHDAGVPELVTYGVNNEIEGFHYERLTVVLLKELQEHKAMIQELTAKVAALEAKG